MNRIMGVAAAIGAVAFLVVGAAAVKWYVWDIAIGEAGQSDRSMLFWGLPILFIGVFAIGAFVGLIVLARRAFSES